MEEIIKCINLQNGELFAELDERRIKLCECDAKVEIKNHYVTAPVLGKGRIIAAKSVVLLITFNHSVGTEIDLNDLCGFSFCGDVILSNGAYKKITFKNCILNSDLDLADGGNCEFTVQCSANMMRELKEM